jgi:hypothetical protein
MSLPPEFNARNSSQAFRNVLAHPPEPQREEKSQSEAATGWTAFPWVGTGSLVEPLRPLVTRDVAEHGHQAAVETRAANRKILISICQG